MPNILLVQTELQQGWLKMALTLLAMTCYSCSDAIVFSAQSDEDMTKNEELGDSLLEGEMERALTSLSTGSAADVRPYWVGIDVLTHRVLRYPVKRQLGVAMPKKYGDFHELESAFQRQNNNSDLYPASPYILLDARSDKRLVNKIKAIFDDRLNREPPLNGKDWEVDGSRQIGQFGYAISTVYTFLNSKTRQTLLIATERRQFAADPEFQLGELSKEAAEAIATLTPDEAAQRDGDGDTLLHVAVRNRRDTVARALVAKFPELSSLRNSRGQTPFQLAAWTGSNEMLQLLGADARIARIKDYEGNNALHSLCFGSQLYAEDQAGKLDWLLKTYPEMAIEKNGFQSTPLHLAAFATREDLVETLYKSAPESLKSQDVDGDTPLHLVAMKQRLVSPLQEQGGDDDEVLISTPMRRLGEEAKGTAAAILFEQTIDGNQIRNRDGLTAMQVLEENGSRDMTARAAAKYVRTEPPKAPPELVVEGNSTKKIERTGEPPLTGGLDGGRDNMTGASIAGAAIAALAAVLWAAFTTGRKRVWGLLIGGIVAAACLLAPKLLGKNGQPATSGDAGSSAVKHLGAESHVDVTNISSTFSVESTLLSGGNPTNDGLLGSLDAQLPPLRGARSSRNGMGRGSS